MNFSLILIIVVLGIYLVWKLMGTGNRKKYEQRRFNIGKHRRRRTDDDENEDDQAPS